MQQNKGETVAGKEKEKDQGLEVERHSEEEVLTTVGVENVPLESVDERDARRKQAYENTQTMLEQMYEDVHHEDGSHKYQREDESSDRGKAPEEEISTESEDEEEIVIFLDATDDQDEMQLQVLYILSEYGCDLDGLTLKNRQDCLARCKAELMARLRRGSVPLSEDLRFKYLSYFSLRAADCLRVNMEEEVRKQEGMAAPAKNYGADFPENEIYNPHKYNKGETLDQSRVTDESVLRLWKHQITLIMQVWSQMKHHEGRVYQPRVLEKSMAIRRQLDEEFRRRMGEIAYQWEDTHWVPKKNRHTVCLDIANRPQNVNFMNLYLRDVFWLSKKDYDILQDMTTVYSLMAQSEEGYAYFAATGKVPERFGLTPEEYADPDMRAHAEAMWRKRTEKTDWKFRWKHYFWRSADYCKDNWREWFEWLNAAWVGEALMLIIVLFFPVPIIVWGFIMGCMMASASWKVFKWFFVAYTLGVAGLVFVAWFIMWLLTRKDQAISGAASKFKSYAQRREEMQSKTLDGGSKAVHDEAAKFYEEMQGEARFVNEANDEHTGMMWFAKILGALSIFMIPFLGIIEAARYASAARSMVGATSHMSDLAQAISAFLQGFWVSRSSTIERVYYVDEKGELCMFIAAACDRLETSYKHVLMYWDDEIKKFKIANYQSKDAQDYIIVHREAVLQITQPDELVKLIAMAKLGKHQCPVVSWSPHTKNYERSGTQYVPKEEIPENVGSWTSMLTDWLAKAGKEVDEADEEKPQDQWTKEKPDPRKIFCDRRGFAYGETNRMAKRAGQLRVLYHPKPQNQIELQALQKANQEAAEERLAYTVFCSGMYPYWQGAEIPEHLQDELNAKPGLYGSLAATFGKPTEEKPKREVPRKQEKPKGETWADDISDEELKNESFSTYVQEKYADIKELGAYVRKKCCHWGRSWTAWKIGIIIFILIGISVSLAIFRKYRKKRTPWRNEVAADIQLKYGDGEELSFKPNERVYMTVDEKPVPRTYQGITNARGELDLERMLSTHGHVAGDYSVTVMSGDIKSPKVRKGTLTLMKDMRKNLTARAANVKDRTELIKESIELARDDTEKANFRNAKRRVKRNHRIRKAVVEQLATEMLPRGELEAIVQEVKLAVEAVQAENKRLVETTEIGNNDSDMVNQAWMSTRECARKLYGIGSVQGIYGSVRRVEDCLVTNKHILEEISKAGATQLTLSSGLNAASFQTTIPFVEEEWQEIPGMIDMVALPAPKVCASMVRMPVKVLPTDVKGMSAKATMLHAQSREASMDTVECAIEEKIDGTGGKYRVAYYYTDHMPGFSGSTMQTNTTPPFEFAIHSQGAVKGNKCLAVLWSDEGLSLVRNLSLKAPCAEAQARFRNSKN